MSVLGVAVAVGFLLLCTAMGCLSRRVAAIGDDSGRERS